MSEIAVVDVIIPPPLVIDVLNVGVQGPPGGPGPAGPAGPAGPPGEGASGDIHVDSVSVGTNPAQSGAVRLGNNQEIRWRNPTNTAEGGFLKVDDGDSLVLNAVNHALILDAAFVQTPNCNVQGHLRLQQGGTGAAVPGYAYLFVQDNGAGKSQLMIQFATGAAIAIATQA